MDAIEGLNRKLQHLVMPELKTIAPHQRDRALEAAREEPLDLIETIGVLAGLVIALLLTRYSLTDAQLTDRLVAALANFVVAVPLIGVLAGPFLIRRTRRGLARFLANSGDKRSRSRL